MRETTRLRRFEIEMLGDQEQFRLGDSISGAVVVEPCGGQIIGKLRMGIHAVAKIAWSRSSGKNRNPRSSVRGRDSSKQVAFALHYFDVERSVYEHRRASAPSGPDLTKMRAGSRIGLYGLEEFPFVFKLPERGAPSSWSGLYGSVRYWIDAVVEVGGKECFREDVQRQITIVPSLDRTSLPDPIAQTQHFPVAGLACIPAFVSASIQLDRAVYVSGDIVQASITVQNSSTWKISSRVYLINTQIFAGKNGVQKLIKDALVKVEGSPVGVNSSVSWQSSLTVPPNSLPSLLDCAIIKSHYAILLRIRVRSVLLHHYEVSSPLIVIRAGTESVDANLTTETDIAGGDAAHASLGNGKDLGIESLLAETTSIK